MLKVAAATLVIAVVLAGTALAGPFEDGATAYARGDYPTAMRLWRPLAEQGDAAAQHNLGVMLRDGQGVPQNYTEAVKWFRRAAERGNAIAQSDLGVMYANGQGVTQSFSEAVNWYQKAADQGRAATNTSDIVNGLLTVSASQGCPGSTAIGFVEQRTRTPPPRRPGPELRSRAGDRRMTVGPIIAAPREQAHGCGGHLA
jgi:tetratricopeptide (TPR) repeat protein